jgi:tetratricopeptide (TPR) repeat protein
MIVPVSNSAARIALLFVALVLAAALAYSSCRNALAVYYASLPTRVAHERAVQLEPCNSQNWFLLGRYWQYNLEEPDNARAIQAYRTSLSLDPRSAGTWMDIASVYELEGNTSSARDAFQEAKRVYPLSAEVSWRYGNFLLRLGEFPQAFAEIRHSVFVDPNRAAEAFSRCWRVDPDVQVILDKVLPPSGPIYLDAIRELMADAQLGPALSVWARLVALHPRLPLSEVTSFTDMLLFARRPEDAQRVWTEAATLSDSPPTGDPPGTAIWDGGFESGVLGGGLSWNFPSAPSGVQVGIDSKEKHSGQRSLELGFDGKYNVNFAEVCHLAIVQPATSYKFSAWVRTQELTSDQGIRFRLEWSDNSRGVSADTPEFHGTQNWTRADLAWQSPPDTHQLRVCVARNPSDVYNSRIHGTAWVDDVSLVPNPSASRKP